MSVDSPRPFDLRRTSQVWLADVVEAVCHLGPDDTALIRILELLEFDKGAPPTAHPPDRGVTPGQQALRSATDRLLAPDPHVWQNDTPPDPPLLNPVRQDRPPRHLVVAPPVVALEPVTESHIAVSPPHVPLFAPTAIRPMVERALATSVPGRRIDVDALVDAIVRKQPVVRVPRLSRRSLMRGVQLLVDVGPSMEPFNQDQRRLVEQVKSLVGTDGTTVHRFVDTPLERSGPGSAGTWQKYRPPNAATPVLALSDLGIGQPPGGRRDDLHDEWLTMAGILARRGSRLVAFVPYARERWAAPLSSVIDLVVWDRMTTINDIAAVIERHSDGPL